ncbi:hypothetical protein [Alienimonas sp. DA493]|uniref:hypothetical protein n=1 Tax=Alienimonas sp. DA493 TaxID=3373605 RepID=UPI003754B336
MIHLGFEMLPRDYPNVINPLPAVVGGRPSVRLKQLQSGGTCVYYYEIEAPTGEVYTTRTFHQLL